MRPPLSLLYGAAALALLISFCIDWAHTSQGGSIDLRNRVTGARLLAAHLDPYFYKWHEPEPPEYCDPYNNPALTVSKTTATPTALILQWPLALLPYRSGQFVWLSAQWLLLLGAAALWLPRCPAGWPYALLVIFITAFTYTAAWRLHAERGQSYVLLLFLFSGWLAATRTGTFGFLAGLLAGLLITLRPSFALLAPFLVIYRRGQLLGAGVGLVLGLALPLLGTLDCWSQYASAMQTHSSLYRNGIDPVPPPERFPPEIEGMPTDLLANYVTIPYADFSLQALLRVCGLEPFSATWPLVIFAAGFVAWLFWSRRQSLDQLLLSLAIWIFLADFFLPAYRNNYNDVLIVNVVALGLLASARNTWPLALCFLALPVGWAILFFAPMHDGMINVPTFFFTLGAVLMLFLFNSGPRPRKV